MTLPHTDLMFAVDGGGTKTDTALYDQNGTVLAEALGGPCNLYQAPAEGLAEIQHNVYRECLRFCGLERDIELHNVADLPAFTGLGSSSAFTVALLHALHSFKGEFLRPMDLAYEAIQVEQEILQEKVGCQDQVLAAVGGFNLIEFHSARNIAVRRVPVSPARLHEFEAHLCLVFTGIKRRAQDVVAKQLGRIQQNTATLRHMKQMVYLAFEILQRGQLWAEFGELLHEAWMAKRSLDEGVSSPEIDEIYETGRKAGAWGGKLLGAGAGGFLLFFAPPEAHPKLRAVFHNHEVLNVKTNAPGSQIIFS